MRPDMPLYGTQGLTTEKMILSKYNFKNTFAKYSSLNLELKRYRYVILVYHTQWLAWTDLIFESRVFVGNPLTRDLAMSPNHPWFDIQLTVHMCYGPELAFLEIFLPAHMLYEP